MYYNIFSPSSRIYKKYNKLGILLVYLENVGIKSIHFPYSNKVQIYFKDGTELYATCYEDNHSVFLSNGVMIFPNEKRLDWDERMPSYEILYKYNKIIEKERERLEYLKSDDYSEFLPEKLKRKLKLKKIEK